MTRHATRPSEPLCIATLQCQPDALTIIVAHSDAQAARFAGAARALRPDLASTLIPAWDCLPFDRMSPSRAVMGERMAALRAMSERRVVLAIASVESAAQRLPSPDTLASVTLTVGQSIARADLVSELDRLGFAREDEADQPGEVALRGAVIDIVPADGSRAARIRVEGEDQMTIVEIDRFDPGTQRSRATVEAITVNPASEVVYCAPTARPPGFEHRLAEIGPPLRSLFDLWPDARLLLAPGSHERMADHLAQISDARDTRIALCRASGGALPADGLYLTESEWALACDRLGATELTFPEAEPLDVHHAADPVASAEALIERAHAHKRRVGLSGRRLARALDVEAEPVSGWAGLARLPAGAIGLLPEGLPASFASKDAVVLAAADVLPTSGGRGVAGLFDIPLRPGDAVIHLDYGMARLDGIETVNAGQPADCLVLGFAGDARKLVPCAEMDRVWRYGAGTEGVALDRADGSSWAKRQGEVMLALANTAEDLVRQARDRAELNAPAIKPSRRAMDRLAAGFGFSPTPDQERAFNAIADDLAQPHPMNRLLCGDVGFGKTEAALRAVAAVALAGHQVAVLAPTTVLVRQHLATFSRRLGAVGVEVAAISRLTGAAEARSIAERLADGRLKVVIGTQALASEDVRFADLALVVIDEEQRFGTKDKAALAAFHGGVHTLALSATPIPRTLEGALAGLRSLSVLTTPPVRRQPVRTSVSPVDEAVIKAALVREHGRGGQSFCVCSRIDEIEAIATLLERLVPDLSVVILHGRMKPDALDAAIVGFAEGHGDVLLATDIIESGLDIPRANTMLVFHADRFGLSQLHQLRGRVGRGRVRGMAWLFTDRAAPPTEAGVQRLAALAAHDGLGAGFAIAARDLDLRGAGDLLGEEQAGHVKLLGVELARHLLGQALARARGDDVEDDWRPETVLDLPATIPESYIPDPAARIALHARLARPHQTASLVEELEDRFGPLPESVRLLLALAALRSACRRLGIARLEAGPTAVAADMRGEPPEVAGLDRKGRRLVLRRASASAAGRLAVARSLLRLISAASTEHQPQAAEKRPKHPTAMAKRA